MTDGLLHWGYPGTWQQAKAHAQSEAVATGGGASPAWGDAGDGGTVRMAPVLLPARTDLTASAFSGPEASGGGLAPLACRCVAAGRMFGLFIGDPVQPMPDKYATPP